MKANLWFILLSIVELKNGSLISTTYLGRRLGISQQSASRYIRILEKQGLISRTVTQRGQKIIVTEDGMNKLRDVYLKLRILLGEEFPSFTIKGKVFTGFGEGAYYISRSQYSKQFEQLLGFKPFPGTLNLRLIDEADIKTRRTLENLPGILVESFEDECRSFGDVKCFHTSINGQFNGAIILVKRTHYSENVVEVIAEYNLREKMNLKDGDIVKLKIKFGG